MWGAIAQIGLTVLGSMGQQKASSYNSKVDRYNLQAQEAVAKGQIAQSKWATNARATQSALGQHLQALNNKRISAAAGKAHAAVGDNASRVLSQRTAGGFEQSIAQAQELGAISAAAGAQGMAGSGVDAIERAQRLTRDRAQGYYAKGTQAIEYDMALQVGTAASDVMAQMSMDTTLPETNISAYVPGGVARAAAGPNILGMVAQNWDLFSAIGKNLGATSYVPNTATLPSQYGLRADADGLGLKPSFAFQRTATNLW